MNRESKIVLLSKTEATPQGAEGVYATISNDFAKDENGKPIYGKEYRYLMFGANLHGPIPEDLRGGFGSFEEAETAARTEYREWRAGNIPHGTKIPRHVYWRTQYRRDRYMAHLTAEELAERSNDLMNNLMTLTEDKKIGVRAMDKPGSYISAAYTNILEECVLREYEYPFPLDRVKEWHYPHYDWPGIDKAIAAFKRRKLKPGTFLVKYGEMKYLKPAFESGAIRISPASRYDDPWLNYAIRDTELELKIHLRPTGNLVLNDSPPELNSSTSRMSELEILKAPTNYYVYCLAGDFDIRLFGDFRADACLLITDIISFAKRLVQTVCQRLPGWIATGTGVKYVDPFNITKEEIDLIYCKDFRYAYQKEYRFIWTPPSPATVLDPIDISVGSLNDCCDLISLK
jgi:hypothetical protein